MSSNLHSDSEAVCSSAISDFSFYAEIWISEDRKHMPDSNPDLQTEKLNSTFLNQFPSNNFDEKLMPQISMQTEKSMPKHHLQDTQPTNNSAPLDQQSIPITKVIRYLPLKTASGPLTVPSCLLKQGKLGEYTFQRFFCNSYLTAKKYRNNWSGRKIIRPKKHYYVMKITRSWMKYVNATNLDSRYEVGGFSKLVRRFGDNKYLDLFMCILVSNIGHIKQITSRSNRFSSDFYYCIFEDEITKECFRYFVLGIFEEKNCYQLEDIFGFACCGNKEHCEVCLEKWTYLRDFSCNEMIIRTE